MLAGICNNYNFQHSCLEQSTGVRWGGQITVSRHTLRLAPTKIKIQVSPTLLPSPLNWGQGREIENCENVDIEMRLYSLFVSCPSQASLSVFSNLNLGEECW